MFKKLMSKDKNKISKEREKELELFMKEYRELVTKYQFDFKAVLQYLPEGIVASFTIIDLKKQNNDTSRNHKSS